MYSRYVIWVSRVGYTVSVEQMRWQTSCVTGKSNERVVIVDLGERAGVSEANELPIDGVASYSCDAVRSYSFVKGLQLKTVR